MGFTSANGFNKRFSGSAGTISMSRDLFRLHRGLDFFRIFRCTSPDPVSTSQLAKSAGGLLLP